MRLENKVAIVTGAATGIGQAIATRFAKEGACVVVDYTRTPPGDTLEAIAAFGGKCIAVKADVSEPTKVQYLITRALKAFGHIDIVVNNAGVERKNPFVDIP